MGAVMPAALPCLPFVPFVPFVPCVPCGSPYACDP